MHVRMVRSDPQAGSGCAQTIKKPANGCLPQGALCCIHTSAHETPNMSCEWTQPRQAPTLKVDQLHAARTCVEHIEEEADHTIGHSELEDRTAQGHHYIAACFDQQC